MKKLAIIGAGTRAEYIAIACRNLKVESHLFSLDNCDPKVFSLVDYFHNVDIFDIDKLVEICTREKINGVCSTTEITIAVAAKLTSVLGLNGNPVEVAERITNKFANRKLVANVDGLKSPKFAEICTPEDVEHFKFTFPLILKPEAFAGGKQGVIVVRTRQELISAFKFTSSNVKSRFNDKVLAEEFLVGGQEYSVESLSSKKRHYIVQITQKDSDNGLHCVELGHHQPAELSSEMSTKVRNVISDSLTAIGLENGPCHTEIKIIDGEIYLIEFNARPGGDHISWPMVELSTGYPYIEGVVQIALDEFKPIDVSSLKHRYSGLYYVAKQTSYLKPIFDVCEQYSWCWKKHKVSDTLEELTHNDLENMNYFIYSSDEGNPVAKLLKQKNKN